MKEGNGEGAGGVSVSVVSHGHGEQIRGLLDDMARCSGHWVRHVILTLNIGDTGLRAWVQERTWPFQVSLVENSQPKGFGANHNAAFRQVRSRYFGVLNPDLQWTRDPFGDLRGLLASAPDVGCAYPVQLDERGLEQDSRRTLPTPARLLARRFGRRHAALPGETDWVNGAFMLFRSDVFSRIGGFDERYFMYCEDTDICLRLQLAGFRLAGHATQVTHLARRASHRTPRHVGWHLRSLVRLWFSDAYRDYRRLRGGRAA